MEITQQLRLESLNIEGQLPESFMRGQPVTDTTLQMITGAMTGPQEIHGLQVDIGKGRQWWMTRLYFLSSLAVDLASIEVMVFVGDEGAFLGIVNSQIVKERLSVPIRG